MKLLAEELTELLTEEKELIITVRKFISKGLDVEVRRNKAGEKFLILQQWLLL